MIYDQINTTFESLANQWHDLANSLRRLARRDPAGNRRRLNIERQISLCDQDPSIALPSGYRQRAQIFAVGPDINPSIQNAIRIAITNLQVHERYRRGIETNFAGIFPTPADGKDKQKEVLDCRNKLKNLQRLIADKLQYLQELIASPESINLGGLRGKIDDIASYPVLTSELGTSLQTSVPSGPNIGGSATSLQRTVDTALREVLGHQPNKKNSRSFLLALNQAFQVHEVEGHKEVTWVQRSYIGRTNLSDGVTGGQASLYTRSKVVLDNALPLLDGLYPLLPDYDKQLAEAARTIVNSELGEIVSELGVEGGPRVARVDQLFESLLKTPNTNPDPYGPSIEPGHLGYLKFILGLSPDQVNTLEEEHNVTNFIALHEYVISIRDSWTNFRKQWLGRDLGTRLVQLSRTLSVTAETVNEVRFAMDSVFVGPAERQVVAFKDQDNNDVFIDELLSWVEDFSNDEAPNLVKEAGKRGAAAITPTGQLLVNLVAQFVQEISDNSDLPAGLRHPRVLPPLRELHTYLQRVVELAQVINQPVSVS